MPNVPNSFSAYPVSVVLDGSGNGSVSFQATGKNLIITNIFVSVSTRTNQAAAKIYKQNVGPQWQLSVTNSGSTGGSANGTIALFDGETVYVVWTGGDPGATATATFTGAAAPFDIIKTMLTQFVFTDPIAASDGTLIFPGLQSVDYATGISGWRIDRTGNAEFNSATIRGSVIVTDPDGSYVRIYDEDPGDGAIIEMGLPTSIGTTRTPGRIRNESSPDPALQIVSPTVDGTPTAIVSLVADTTLDVSRAIVGATDVILEAENTVYLDGFNVVASYSVGGSHNFVVEDTTSLATFEGDIAVDGNVLNDLSVQGRVTALNGYTVPIVQIGTESVTFAAATSFTVNVTFPNAFPVGVVPNVMVNMATGSGSTRWWKVKADTFTNTGFRLLGDTTDAAAAANAWSAIPVSWIAVAI